MESVQYAIRVKEKGDVRLPEPLRSELNIQTDDLFTAILLGDSILLTPQKLEASLLTERIADLFKNEGITVEKQLENLATQRDEIWREKWAQESEL